MRTRQTETATVAISESGRTTAGARSDARACFRTFRCAGLERFVSSVCRAAQPGLGIHGDDIALLPQSGTVIKGLFRTHDFPNRACAKFIGIWHS
jgi:hypothetical protein